MTDRARSDKRGFGCISLRARSEVLFGSGWLSTLRGGCADAIRYLNRLSEAEGLAVCYEGERFRGLDCEGYRLPTNAEWEHAARAGSRREPDVDAVAWHKGNGGGTTHPVGQKQANDWGLFDMIGNVLEWTQDESNGEYDKAAAAGGVQVDPLFLGSRIAHVRRGGSFDDPPAELAKYRRTVSMPTSRLRWNGLRPARTIR